MEMGEVEAVCSFYASLASGPQKSRFVDGTFVPIVQMGVKKHPAFGQAPSVYDLARTNDERVLMRFIFSLAEITRPFAAPPGVPEDRVAALRKAFWEAANSEDLKSDAGRLGLQIDPMDWRETDAAFREVLTTRADIVEKAKQAIRAR
jgi:hypothetical protein